MNDSVPEEHKAGIDMRRDMLRRSHTLIVCGSAVDEDVKNDIAVAGRLGIAATTLEGVLAVKGHGLSLIHIWYGKSPLPWFRRIPVVGSEVLL